MACEFWVELYGNSQKLRKKLSSSHTDRNHEFSLIGLTDELIDQNQIKSTKFFELLCTN